jgi:uncharacterized protein YqcC (DUF446 family)
MILQFIARVQDNIWNQSHINICPYISIHPFRFSWTFNDFPWLQWFPYIPSHPIPRLPDHLAHRSLPRGCALASLRPAVEDRGHVAQD